jgi:broad specificity phosphatase PhoE
MKFNNKYYIMRHGEALSNIKEIVSCWPEKFKNPLTKNGRKIVKESAKKLKNKKISLIFCSPLLRTKQTAEIVGKILKIKPRTDKRLREVGFGVFNFGPISNLWNYFSCEEERIKKGPPKGESYTDILKRVSDFFKEINKKYKNKNILIISHEGPFVFLEGMAKGLSLKETLNKFPLEKRIHKAEIRELN